MSKITESARDEDCTIRIPGVCNYDTSTTVWCHSNRSKDGKGMGLKAHDENGAYGCSSCHLLYDRQRPRPKGMSLEFVEQAFTNAMEKSRRVLVAKGLISADKISQKIPSGGSFSESGQDF